MDALQAPKVEHAALLHSHGSCSLVCRAALTALSSHQFIAQRYVMVVMMRDAC
jgi:hypothetical protein